MPTSSVLQELQELAQKSGEDPALADVISDPNSPEENSVPRWPRVRASLSHTHTNVGTTPFFIQLVNTFPLSFHFDRRSFFEQTNKNLSLENICTSLLRSLLGHSSANKY